MDLNFNHPVKELVWIWCCVVKMQMLLQAGLYDRGAINAGTYQLKLNG